MVDAVVQAVAAELEAVFSSIVAVTLSPRCLLCRASIERPLFGPICASCWSSLPSLHEPFCPRCRLEYTRALSPGLCGPCRDPRRAFRRASAAGPYDGALKELIHQFKYGRRFRLGHALGELAFDRCLETGLLEGVCAVPVPLHWRRRRERGYNQAELLAKSVARKARIPWYRALKKVKHGPPQAELGIEARRKNARGAYRARLPAALVGRPILLVDDVFTTGATIEACARALRRAGASDVDALTVARVSLNV